MRRSRAIDKEVIDIPLTNDQKPENIIGEKGPLKQLIKALVERATEAELTHHLGYAKHDPAGYGNGHSRKGKSKKKLKGDLGEVEIELPRARVASCEPKIVPTGGTRFQALTASYLCCPRGLPRRQMQSHCAEL